MKIEDVFGPLPLLETKRLILRKMTIDDAEDLFEYASDPEVARQVLWNAHRCIEDARNYLLYMIKKYEHLDVAEWGIVHKQDQKFIGTCGFAWWDIRNSRAEIGYALSRKYWNNGLMTEAVQAVIRFGFKQMKLNRIEARCMLDNPASERIMQKVGMRFEGIMRKHAFAKGEFHDLKMYALLKGE
jgi:ribosomal-protein-alanine N-acetyltransferase